MICNADETALLHTLGKDAWREGQLDLIRWVVGGHASLGILPTGYGKSLCYQAAALQMGGLSIVVSPLIALMRDQVQQLQALGIAAARFDSSLSEEQREELCRQLCEDELRLLYVAPESLENAQLSAAIEQAQLSLFVVDEAHCVSEWGHSFRPDYLKLPSWYAQHKFRALMALSATATPVVQAELRRAFGITEEHSLIYSPQRSNIRRLVLAAQDKPAALHAFLKDYAQGASIVYCRTRKQVEELAALISSWGYVARAYHAGQPSDQRERLQDAFLLNEINVLVATIAFGMGVDKPDLRAVLHYDAPSSPEAYVQESGRAGRDGEPAYSMVLLNGSDSREISNRIKAEEPDAEGLLRCLRWLLPSNQRVVSLWELSTECDLAEDVPQRALKLLEGSVELLGRGYKHYKVRPLYSLSTILDGRDDQEQARLRWLDQQRDAEVEAAAQAWDCSYLEAMSYLQDCEAAQEWSLKFRQQAMLLSRCGNADTGELAEQLSSYYSRRREASLTRWAQMKQMLQSSSCLNAALERYFMGEDAIIAPCGNCSACLGSPCGELSDPPEPPSLEPGAELPSFAREGQRKRFLLGIASPSAMRRRLWGHRYYAALAGADWDDL